MLIPEGGIWRFCDDCRKESTEENPATWSIRFTKRLCMGCYNLRCEAVDAEHDVEFCRYKYGYYNNSDWGGPK